MPVTDEYEGEGYPKNPGWAQDLPSTAVAGFFLMSVVTLLAMSLIKENSDALTRIFHHTAAEFRCIAERLRVQERKL